MISVVTWLWHDPTLVGGKKGHEPPPVELRCDLMPRRIRGRPRALQPNRPLRHPRFPPLVATATRPARSFLSEHVNMMQKMFARHLTEPHRFICIADDGTGLSPEVEFLKTPAAATAVANMRSPEGPRFPSCYRRLWGFSEEARVLGDRILVLDIDVVATRDLAPITVSSHDFLGWRPFRDWGRRLRFGGGIYLLKTGTRTKVWDEFAKHPQGAINAARAAGFRGSDQAWISYKLAEKEPYWDKNSGLYSIRDLGPDQQLPKDARLVQFNGHKKPWDYSSRDRAAWVAAHWR